MTGTVKDVARNELLALVDERRDEVRAFMIRRGR